MRKQSDYCIEMLVHLYCSIETLAIMQCHVGPASIDNIYNNACSCEGDKSILGGVDAKWNKHKHIAIHVQLCMLNPKNIVFVGSRSR